MIWYYTCLSKEPIFLGHFYDPEHWALLVSTFFTLWGSKRHRILSHHLPDSFLPQVWEVSLLVSNSLEKWSQVWSPWAPVVGLYVGWRKQQDRGSKSCSYRLTWFWSDSGICRKDTYDISKDKTGHYSFLERSEAEVDGDYSAEMRA
jgi:hypothetical protein